MYYVAYVPLYLVPNTFDKPELQTYDDFARTFEVPSTKTLHVTCFDAGEGQSLTQKRRYTRNLVCTY